MSGSIENLAIIVVAVGTYGSLAFVIMRSVFKSVRRQERRPVPVGTSSRWASSPPRSPHSR